MKKLAVLVAAVAALGAAFAGPSQAAGPYTIAGPAAIFVDGATRFKLASCNPQLDNSPSDGVDSQIVNVQGRGGTTLAVTWSAEPTIASTLPGQLSAVFVSASCATLGNQAVVSRKPGPWSVPVPPGTKWMIVVSSFEVQVRFSFP